MDTTTAPKVVLHPSTIDDLDEALSIPLHHGMQRQGDVLILPAKAKTDKRYWPLPEEGLAVIQGEADRNTHLLIGQGVTYAPNRANNLLICSISVPEGSTGYLIHPEHTAIGIAPGHYQIRRQREFFDEERHVVD